MKFIVKFLKVILKLLKPFIKMGLFNDLFSQLAEDYSIEL